MVRLVLLGVAIALTACGRFAFDDLSADPTGDARSSDGTPGGDCPGTAGPAMLRVAGGFCIDTTEVTKAQYAEFLAAMRPVQTDAACAFNTTYVATDYVWNATTDPDQAVAGVDWCDARDYCAWAGKRLCGRMGGGSLGYAEHASADSQWYVACSQGAGRAHPYGTAADDTAKPGYCHLDNFDNALGRQAVVGSFPQCKLVDADVYDLLGNLEEWIDACEAPGSDPAASRCKVVGGVWYFESSYSTCSFFDPAGGAGVRRDTAEKHTGIRCCAD